MIIRRQFFCLLVLVLTTLCNSCSCEPEQDKLPPVIPAGVNSADKQDSDAHYGTPEKNELPPQPAPKVAGRTNALLPSNHTLTFSALGVPTKIYYTQLSASLVKDSYHFTIEAKTRGHIKGEKSTQQAPPYMRLSWKVNKSDLKKITDLAGKSLSADCVLLLGHDRWASSSSVKVSIGQVANLSLHASFVGTFRFVSGPLQGRSFEVTEGHLTAFISKAIPTNIQ